MCLFVQGNDDFCTTHQPHPQTPIPKTHLVTRASQGTARCNYHSRTTILTWNSAEPLVFEHNLSMLLSLWNLFLQHHEALS